MLTGKERKKLMWPFLFYVGLFKGVNGTAFCAHNGQHLESQNTSLMAKKKFYHANLFVRTQWGIPEAALFVAHYESMHDKAISCLARHPVLFQTSQKGQSNIRLRVWSMNPALVTSVCNDTCVLHLYHMQYHIKGLLQRLTRAAKNESYISHNAIVCHAPHFLDFCVFM